MARRNVVAWAHLTDGLDSPPNRPLAVLFGDPRQKLLEKLKAHYSEERWDRLGNNMLWIFLDLFNIFDKGDEVWEAVKKNRMDREKVSSEFSVFFANF
jgi:hypothetical protein